MALATKKQDAEAKAAAEETAAEEAQPDEEEGTSGTTEVVDPEDAPEITSPEAPLADSPAIETPSGYAASVADGDPDAYAKARAEKRYGYGGS